MHTRRYEREVLDSIPGRIGRLGNELYGSDESKELDGKIQRVTRIDLTGVCFED